MHGKEAETLVEHSYKISSFIFHPTVKITMKTTSILTYINNIHVYAGKIFPSLFQLNSASTQAQMDHLRRFQDLLSSCVTNWARFVFKHSVLPLYLKACKHV